MVETINKLRKTNRLLLQKYGRKPTENEIAKKSHMSVEKVREIIKVSQLRHARKGVADGRGAEAPGGELAPKTAPGMGGAGQETEGLDTGAHALGARKEACPCIGVQDGPHGEALPGENLRMEQKERAVGEVDADRLSGGSFQPFAVTSWRTGTGAGLPTVRTSSSPPCGGHA